MLPFAKASRGIANDIIPELINLWIEIRDNPELVAKEYEHRWKELQSKGPEVYYSVRDSFNATRNCFDFLFLTRTCVNGMIRYNSNGDFNNSFHLSRPGIDPRRLSVILSQWSSAIQKFEFLNCDYRECLSSAKKGDFVFLDPPYGGTKDRYTQIEFNLSDFYSELERLNFIGAFWMLTFDGSAGDRVYSFAPPEDIFSHKFMVSTGNSAYSLNLLMAKRTKFKNQCISTLSPSMPLEYFSMISTINFFTLGVANK